MKIVLLSFSIALILACHSESKLPTIVNLDGLTDNSSLIDFPLSIVNSKNSDGYVKYTVQATSLSDTLELIIGLKQDIPAGIVNGVPRSIFIEKGIVFYSTGEKSDKLLTTLGRKYGVGSGDIKMKTTQLFTPINLNEQNINYTDGKAKFKITLKNEIDQAELFINFDFQSKLISLMEINFNSRQAILKLMQQ